ncbi:hypothetical protein GCL60_09700 [Silvanigrella paludirubra]|uniref:Uncharacterized protein n=1 Tax=Silvanigrella paludirubra TaxID=2499159 RepID=A0A6N6VWQ7_9BACT|nr:hypothetical protein [Silvanigrella paludirubra]KAB8039119.1 hypothetical protein GCL60_09700 [Silvanigrella paludirubra]
MNSCKICNNNSNDIQEITLTTHQGIRVQGCMICGEYVLMGGPLAIPQYYQNLPQFKANMVYYNVKNKINKKITYWFLNNENKNNFPDLNENISCQSLEEVKNLNVIQSKKYIDILKIFNKKIDDSKIGAFDFFKVELCDLYLCKLTSVKEYLIILDYLIKKSFIILNNIDFISFRDSYMNNVERWNNNSSLINKFLNDNHEISLTIEAYQLIEEEIKFNKSNKVFIAMKFCSNQNQYIEAVNQACNAVNHDLIASTVSQFHNDNITFRIFNEIRESRFVIADFTPDIDGTNYTEEFMKYKTDGSYFEAGYAYGLGKDVIYTVRKDIFEKRFLHFDISQINFVVWEDYEKLKEKLIDRIRASIILS